MTRCSRCGAIDDSGPAAPSGQLVFYHRVLNHRPEIVCRMAQLGLIMDVEKDPHFRCTACEVAHAALYPFGSAGREVPVDRRTIVPFSNVEVEIYGPVDCGDRNGFRFLAGFICTGVGAVSLQSMQAKSGAVGALEAFLSFSVPERFKPW